MLDCRVEFQKFQAFADIKEETIELIKLYGEKKSLSKGEILFLERDKVDKVYFIIKGKVTMYRISEGGQKRIIYILNEGNFVNEVIFDGLSASISCEAFENCEFIYFYKNELLNIMSKDFELNKIIINSMGKKIRRLYRQLKNTVSVKIEKKVAAKLWMLSRDYGKETQEGILLDINLSITNIALMLGSARETISKAMSKLEKYGLIRYQGKKILIPDRKAISTYFRGIE